MVVGPRSGQHHAYDRSPHGPQGTYLHAVGSMTQYDRIRVGKGADKIISSLQGHSASCRTVDDIVFGAWDLYPADAYDAAIGAEVLKEREV